MSFRGKTINTLKWSSIEKIGQFGVQLIISIILARLLDAQVYGVIGVINIFIVLSATITDAGFSQGLIRKLDCTDEDYNSVFWFNLMIGVLLYVILFLTAPYIAILFRNPDLCLLSRVLFLVIPISSFNIIQVTKINKELNFKSIAKYTLAASILSGGMGILLAFMGYGVWALIGQTLVSSVLLVFFFAYKSNWHPKFHFSFGPIKELFPFSSMLFATSFLNTLFNNLYTFLIARWYSDVQLGYYTQANKFAVQPTNLIEGIFNRMAYPLFSRLQNNIPEYFNTFRKLQVSLFAFVFPGMSLLALCAYEGFFLVLGEEWLPSVRYFQIMCLSGITLPFHPLCTSTIKVFGKSKLIFHLEVVKKILIVLLILVTFRDGILGLIWGQFVFFWIALIMNMYYGGKQINYRLTKQILDLLPYVGITFVSLLSAWLVSLLLENLYIVLSLKMSIFATIYIVLLYIFKLPEAKIFTEFIKKIR